MQDEPPARLGERDVLPFVISDVACVDSVSELGEEVKGLGRVARSAAINSLKFQGT